MFFHTKGYYVMSTQLTKISDVELHGMVEFETANEATRCLKRLGGFEYLGRKLELKPYIPLPEKPVDQPEPSSLVEEEEKQIDSFEEISAFPSKFEVQDNAEICEDFEKFQEMQQN